MDLDGLRGQGIRRPTPDAATPPRPARVPTNEEGLPAQNYSLGLPDQTLGGILPWPSYFDEREFAEQLRWPLSVAVYSQMQGDAMLSTLLTTVGAPVRRFRWEIDPNDARSTVVKHVAESWNLPVRGAEEQPIGRGFNHDRHLALALGALAYGHMYFEEIYEQGVDGRFRLRKLGSRPPRTIANFLINEHGELLGIVQKAGVQQLWGANFTNGGITLEANRLLAYVWNPADDGDWLGRSALRSCFKNWLVKDRLIRVDATKHERTGMGIPWVEMEAKSTKAQIEQASAIAEELRVSQRGGAAGVGKLRLVGVEGSVPETITSIRYHDQQMTSAFLAMFVELGKGETGSYALGEALMDFHSEFIGSVADWYVEETMAVIEREVEINWGRDEPCPRIAYTRLESQALSFTDLALGIEKGAIAPDESIRRYVRERWKLPDEDEPDEAEGALALPQAEPAPEPPAEVVTQTTAPPASAQPQRGKVAEEILAALDRPMEWAAVAAAIGRSPKDGTARRARDKLIADGAIVKGATRLAPTAGLQLPDRELHRNPKPFEVEAAVNFAAMEEIYVSGRDKLVSAVRAAQATQFSEVAAAVEAAGGDPAALGSIQVAPMPIDVLLPAMLEAARNGEAAATAERQAQVGAPAAAAADEPDQERTDQEVRERAIVTAAVLAAGLGAAASKKAAALTTLPPADAAEATKDYLEGLTDAALNEQLGAAVHKSYAAGRVGVMRANRPSAVYASEILDNNTCTTCSSEDGTEWPNVEEAESDYPGGGGFIECEGGLRCRGILVAVYA